MLLVINKLDSTAGYLDPYSLGLEDYHASSIGGMSNDVIILLGLSVWPIITILIIFLLLVGFIIDFAVRLLPGKMPLVGTNSICISSCCHAASWEGVQVDSASGNALVFVEANLRSDRGPSPESALRWGVITNEESYEMYHDGISE